MGVALTLQSGITDTTLASIAREVAMDINNIDDILKAHEITPRQWERIQKNPQFAEYLKSEIVAWQSAVNTEQRIKLKSAALIEMWLREANTRLHSSDPLAAKVELAKLIARLAGMGLTGANVNGDTAEKVNITINLGSDQSIKVEKVVTQTGNMIDVTPTQTE